MSTVYQLVYRADQYEDRYEIGRFASRALAERRVLADALAGGLDGQAEINECQVEINECDVSGRAELDAAVGALLDLWAIVTPERRGVLDIECGGLVPALNLLSDTRDGPR